MVPTSLRRTAGTLLVLLIAPACVQHRGHIRSLAAEKMSCPKSDVKVGAWGGEWIALGCGKAFGCESFQGTYECTSASAPLRKQLETELGCTADDFAAVGRPYFARPCC